MHQDRHGIVQVYTGDGKGKTTAALGLAVRAAGAGLHVFFGQFCKGRPSSEHVALERFADLITVRHCGGHGFITGEPSEEDRAAAAEMLQAVREAMLSGDYDIVVADELNVAVDLGLVKLTEVLDLLDDRPLPVELVLTGRNAHPALRKRAELVTEMRAIKHPYEEGLPARKGIEY
ncbi:MAG: cob(I)yrinic acid a,c-diamide adenosyltransferase [Armatimonadia bacterium]